MNSTDLSIQLSLELQVKLRRASFIASLSFVKKCFGSQKKQMKIWSLQTTQMREVFFYY